MTEWLKTPPGEYLLAWEREQFDQAVSDIFGYHALQLGFDELDAPVRRMNGGFTPTPYSPSLEAAIVPNPKTIAQAIRDLIKE